MQITLTKVNDEGFDPQTLGMNLQNALAFRVFEVISRKTEGNLDCVTLECAQGDLSDPQADPMLIGTIQRQIRDPQTNEYITDTQWRIVWNNEIWRLLDDDAISILELQGLDRQKLEQFTEQYINMSLRQHSYESIIRDHPGGFGWENAGLDS